MVSSLAQRSRVVREESGTTTCPPSVDSGDVPVIVDPQAQDCAFGIPGFHKLSCCKDVVQLDLFSVRVASTVVVSHNRNDVRTMVLHRYFDPALDRVDGALVAVS